MYVYEIKTEETKVYTHKVYANSINDAKELVQYGNSKPDRIEKKHKRIKSYRLIHKSKGDKNG